jgi:DNA transposition AAA+ family ATPase
MNDQPNTIWTMSTTPPAADGPGRTDKDIADWRDLTIRVAFLAQTHNWSKAEVARRSGMADGTLNQWFSGLYKGRIDTQNVKIRQWLDSVEEMATLAAGIPNSPEYIETKTAWEITQTLLYAQTMPEMAVITLSAGMGKTQSCRAYCNRTPHAYLVTMSPHTKTVHGMLVEIAAALGVTQHNPAKLHRAIGERLQRNGRKTLLIVDEAQNLVDQAVDQLRSFLDINECGIALVGNDEIYDRFKNRSDGPSYAQIKRRFGKRLRRTHPYPEDIGALIDAWGITDDGARRLLTGIGNKPGALGQIDKTLKLAAMAASGEQAAISEQHIRAAWKNRAVED